MRGQERGRGKMGDFRACSYVEDFFKRQYIEIQPPFPSWGESSIVVCLAQQLQKPAQLWQVSFLMWTQRAGKVEWGMFYKKTQQGWGGGGVDEGPERGKSRKEGLRRGRQSSMPGLKEKVRAAPGEPGQALEGQDRLGFYLKSLAWPGNLKPQWKSVMRNYFLKVELRGLN